MGSVLYVTESPQTDKSQLAVAQHYAIEQNLPYAVVYCLEEPDVQKQLSIMQGFRPMETMLGRHGVPFMILIGKRDKVLPWMSGHVKPVRVFTADDTAGQGTETLRQHPVKWPGVVMTINELQAMVSGDQGFCMPA